MVVPFALALMASWAASLLLRRGSMLVATGILSWDWLLCVALAGADGDGLSWFGLFCIDFGCALLLLILHNRRWQLAVVAVFVPMIALHVGFGIVGKPWAHVYLRSLEVLSWAQLSIIWLVGLYHVAESLGYQPRFSWRVLPDRQADGFSARGEQKP